MKSIARIFRYTPETLSLLYIDDHDDIESLDFWYRDALLYEKEISNLTNK